MRYSNQLVAFCLVCLSLILSPVGLAQEPTFSPEVQMDLLTTEIALALEKADHKGVIAGVDRARKLNIALPPKLLYIEARSRVALEQYIEARPLLEQYINAAGRKGKYYQDALKLYVTVKAKAEEQETERKKAQEEAARKAEEAQLAKLKRQREQKLAEKKRREEEKRRAAAAEITRAAQAKQAALLAEQRKIQAAKDAEARKLAEQVEAEARKQAEYQACLLKYNNSALKQIFHCYEGRHGTPPAELLAAEADCGQSNDGRCLVIRRDKGNCTSCHQMAGLPAVWGYESRLPNGEYQVYPVGPEINYMKARYPDRNKLRAVIRDASQQNPHTDMPIYGPTGRLTEDEINRITDFIHTL